jgi:hypothetical protein
MSFEVVAGERPSQCDEYYHVGHAIMYMRQKDVPLAKIMDRVDGLVETKALIIKMLNEAYRSPVFETQEAKEKAARDFGNKMYLGCYDK